MRRDASPLEYRLQTQSTVERDQIIKRIVGNRQTAILHDTLGSSAVWAVFFEGRFVSLKDTKPSAITELARFVRLHSQLTEIGTQAIQNAYRDSSQWHQPLHFLASVVRYTGSKYIFYHPEFDKDKDTYRYADSAPEATRLIVSAWLQEVHDSVQNMRGVFITDELERIIDSNRQISNWKTELDEVSEQLINDAKRGSGIW